MFLTGRTPLLAAIAVAVAFGWPDDGAAVGWLSLGLVVLIAIDALLAGAAGPLQFVRIGDSRGRLGGPIPVGLLVTNTGRRTVRARVRDAWPPSAGQHPHSYKVVIPPGERRRLDGVLVA